MTPSRSLAAAATVLAILSSPAQAAPWGLARGEFYTELSGASFSTRSYLRNADELRTDLGGRFQQYSLTSHSEFGWKKRTTVVLELPFVTRTFAPDDAGARASTGLGDIVVGLRYAMHAGRLPVALELAWSAPTGTNRRIFPGSSGSGGFDGDSIAAHSARSLSDPAMFFSQGLQSLSANLAVGGTAGSRAYWEVAGGMRTMFLKPDARVVRSLAGTAVSLFPFLPISRQEILDLGGDPDRTADFVTSSAAVGIWAGPRVLVGGEFRGEWSVFQGGPYDGIDTPLTSAPDPELVVTRLLAGPRVTFRVDEHMDVFAGSWHTPGGRNVLHHDLYYCGIAWKNTSLDRLAGALGGTKAR